MSGNTVQAAQSSLVTTARRMIGTGLAAALLLAGASGCGEIVSHAPQIATGIALVGATATAALAGGEAYESIQEGRAELHRADQEAARLESLRLDLEAKRRTLATGDSVQIGNTK